ncbi:MAG: hypothetical protein JWR90_3765 [Marmoricola sp.]|nr:hypothetical protein [Marmoricola sp.]
MTHRIRTAVLLLALVLLVPGGHVGRADPPPARSVTPVAQTTTGAPVPVEVPVVVPGVASLNTRGWSRPAAAVGGSTEIAPAVLSAYSLAVAAAPAGCHLPLSLLAAVGQVESANLQGRVLDTHHRVVPAILGPVLDGSPYRAVRDSDAGRWDGNRRWDRALGPMQLTPASWRVVGVDLDGDGLRDPQDIDDAAGAAMVYLCADGRDLSTPAGVEAAVLAYNHSVAYLRTVLAWKAVFDRTDLTLVGSLPVFDAVRLAPLPVAPPPAVAPSPPALDPPVTARPVASPSVSPAPAQTGTQPGTPPAPTAAPPASSDPPATSEPSSDPTTAQPAPTASATPEPDPEPTPSPTPSPDPAPLPTCPADMPVDPTAPVTPPPTAAPTPDPDEVVPTPVPDTSTPEDGDLCLPAPTAAPTSTAEPTPGG